MKRYKLIVMSNAKPGRDDEFNRWYDMQHIPDLMKVPGFKSADRFRIAASKSSWQYLAIYEIETDDMAGVHAEVQRRTGTPLMPISDAFDAGNMFVASFEPLNG
ncbi:MAG TPA: hypothetical protein VEH07_10070 [Alphaproteobacteria bacterium]|nr:hypothetical protein [Alphaproteobacteria bacterium]